MLSLLAVPALLYLLVCAAAFALQGKMLFPAPAPTDERQLPPDAQKLALTTADGVRLVGLHLPGRAGESGAPVLLAFGGNGWSADGAALTLRDLYPQADVVAFHYRGYPPSSGTPTTGALTADSLLVHDWAVRRFQDRKLVPVGFSIGTGIAVHLAARRAVAGLVLVTPYDSLTEVAVSHMPWLPVRLLFRNPLEAAEEMRRVRAPVAILAASDDEVIPAARTEALRRATPRLAYDRTLPGAHHNDIYRRGDFRPAMRRALAAVLAVH